MFDDIVKNVAETFAKKIDEGISKALYMWYNIDINYVLSHREEFTTVKRNNVYTLCKNDVPLLSYKFETLPNYNGGSWKETLKIWIGDENNEPD